MIRAKKERELHCIHKEKRDYAEHECANTALQWTYLLCLLMLKKNKKNNFIIGQ